MNILELYEKLKDSYKYKQFVALTSVASMVMLESDVQAANMPR